MNEMTAMPLSSWAAPSSEEETPELRRLGIKALMLAVLEDAIHSLNASQHMVRVQAERWFASREHGYVFSFAVICETLDLEPSAVRRSVMNLVTKTRAPEGSVRRRSRPNSRQRQMILPAKSALM